jgi:hypothetical protein
MAMSSATTMCVALVVGGLMISMDHPLTYRGGLRMILAVMRSSAIGWRFWAFVPHARISGEIPQRTIDWRRSLSE